MDPIAFTIGKYAPLILFLFTVVYVQPNNAIIYTLFFIVSFISNKLLKSYYAEHRPSKKRTGYGMPSNHAQSIAFSTTFLYLITRSNLLLLYSVIIAMLTSYQRVKTKQHSVQQTVTGTLLGIVFGVGAFHAT
jgi:membrane-associated phospholipid phosphatase